MDNIYGRIYCVTNLVNGKQYIGKTTLSIKTRWALHCRKGFILYSAITKYGKENFTVKEIDCAWSDAELSRLEIIWISKLSTIVPAGYNLKSGGEGGRHHQSTKDKLRLAWNRIGYRDKQTARLKLLNTPQRRAEQSALMIALYNNQDYRNKISAARKARFSDPESRAKMAMMAKEYWNKPESITTAIANRGSEEYRRKMSASISAKWRDTNYRKQVTDHKSTDEYKKKASETRKRAWQSAEYREKQLAARRNSSACRAQMIAMRKARWPKQKE